MVGSRPPFAARQSLLDDVRVLSVKSGNGWLTVPWRFDHDVGAVNHPDPNVQLYDPILKWQGATAASQITSDTIALTFPFAGPVGTPWRILDRPVCVNARPHQVVFPQSGVIIPYP